MSGYIYVHVWPILDKERPFRALVAEACRDLDVMAQLAGARIAGEPVWTVSDDFHLVCRAPARPLDPDEGVEDRIETPDVTVAPPRIAIEKVEQIRALARRGHSINAIAAAVGVRWKTAARYARGVAA